jgi:hypothetical protein
MYNRFDSALLPKENIPNTLTHLVDHTISLSDHARLLEKVIDLRAMSRASTVLNIPCVPFTLTRVHFNVSFFSAYSRASFNT